jgi:glycerol kinase
MKYILALDPGTTSSRAIVFGHGGASSQYHRSWSAHEETD